jgi:hypothetical protein
MNLAEAEAALAAWEAALIAASRGQSYSIEGRSLTRADVGEIRRTIDWLENRIARLRRTATGRGGIRHVS